MLARLLPPLLSLLPTLRPANASPASLSSTPPEHDAPGETPGSPEFWYKLVVAVILVLAGGVFAGLTLGLMGLDELHLRVLAASSDLPQERKNAQKVLKLLNRGRHWVLVVLLLGNVIVNESLPIFLHSALGGGIAAVAISTTMIVIFGSFLAFHRQGEEPLRDDEISILNGVLELNNKKAEEIMTPMNDVVTVSADRILHHDTVDYLLRSGYSRIPVHLPGKPLAFMGILLIKQLSIYDPSTAIPVSEFPLSLLPEAPPNINCFQALDYFQTGRAHLLLLSRTPGVEGGAIGVITLEDIIEVLPLILLTTLLSVTQHKLQEMISEEIVDETDRYEDNVSKRRARRMKNAAVMKGIVEYRVGRANSRSENDRTPLLSRNQSPLPPVDPDGSAMNGTAHDSTLQGTGSRLRPTSNLNPQYGSVIIGSPQN
ncbi:hypothetical protein BC628DRAFT_1419270 [Trametes gibbosa]|nr:hypothetical protein BC628DRAFT_1419270 [Trametes gibbosa]